MDIKIAKRPDIKIAEQSWFLKVVLIDELRRSIKEKATCERNGEKANGAFAFAICSCNATLGYLHISLCYNHSRKVLTISMTNLFYKLILIKEISNSCSLLALQFNNNNNNNK